MDLMSFVATVILITASGALFPGPMFFAVIAHGSRSGAKGGLSFSIGHTLVEFPLVVLLALGLRTVASQPTVELFTRVLGGVALLVFGVLQVRDSLSPSFGEAEAKGTGRFRNPLLLGVVFTGLNPFFIVWWLTVGPELIVDALTLAFPAGVLLMYASHVWMDYVWLIIVAYLARMGINILGTRGYKVLVATFGAVLIGFGVASLLFAL